MAERTLGILVKADGAAKAAGLIGQVDKSVQKLGSSSGLSRFSAGLGRAKGAIGGLVGAMGPLLGIAGVAGLGAAFGSSLTKAEEFGVTVSKLTTVLDLDTQTVSALSDTLDKFGIGGDKQVTVLGRLEKNAGLLAAAVAKGKPLNDAVIKSMEKVRVAQVALSEAESKHNAKQSTILAAKYRVADAERQLADARKKGGKAVDSSTTFEQKYGFNLHLTNGKIADANTLLLRAADYFNGTATATDKNIVLNKLFGKTWTDMIPVLALGSKGIKEEEKNAIHLTQTQLDNISKFKVSQREFADVIGDLQVKVGAELMPMITSALQEASSWLDTHSDDVISFFKGAADFGAQLAQGARAAFGAIKAGWDLIPGPLKTLLIEGLVAGKVTKFLFDFGPMDAAKLGARMLGGSFLQRGGTPANPVFVSDVAGGAGLAEKGALGLGAGGLAGLATITAGVIGILGAYALPLMNPFNKGEARPMTTAAGTLPATGVGSADFYSAIPGFQNLVKQAGGQYVNPSIGDYGTPHPGSNNAGGPIPRSVLPSGEDQRKNLAMQAILQRALNKGFRPSQQAVTNTYERDVARSTALTARRSEELKTAVKNVAPAVVAGIAAAIRNIPQSITNINFTASDAIRVQNQRRRTVKPHGPRGSLVGANEFG